MPSHRLLALEYLCSWNRALDCGLAVQSTCSHNASSSSGLSGREAERDCCAIEVQKRNVCLPCHGIPLMAFFLPLVVQVAIASVTSVSKHVAVSSQTCYFDFFFPVLWKGNGGRSGTARALPSSTLGVGFPSICPCFWLREIPSCPRFCAEAFNADAFTFLCKPRAQKCGPIFI